MVNLHVARRPIAGSTWERYEPGPLETWIGPGNEEVGTPITPN